MKSPGPPPFGGRTSKKNFREPGPGPISSSPGRPANMSGGGTLNSNSRSMRRPACAPLSGVTERSTRVPSRSTAVFTVRPSGVSATSRDRWRALRTCSPSKSVMMSPFLIPAFAAGLSSRTSCTSAPLAVACCFASRS